MSKPTTAPSEPIATLVDYKERNPKVELLTMQSMLRNLAPTMRAVLTEEEEKIRASEDAKEAALKAELELARVATGKATADLVALRKRSLAAGGKTFYTNMGLGSTAPDEALQQRCRNFIVVGEDELSRARLAEEAAYMRFRAACNGHGRRRTYALMRQGIRPADPGRQEEIQQKRAQDLRAFLDEGAPDAGRPGRAIV